MDKRIGFLGVGKMAFAMLKGIISNGIAAPENICGYDISEERRAVLSEMGCCAASDAAQTVTQCDVLVLAIKPQNFTELFDAIRDVLREDMPVISIAAGIPISRIKKLAGKDLPVIRVIPNNPMLAGIGMSVMAYEPPVTDEQARFAESMFKACGKTVIMKEELINPSIAIHSSSPAYLYLFAQAVADYAESVGISRADATEMFAQTMAGSAEMIMTSGSSLDELIAAVRSPGGTTAAALDKLNGGGFRELIAEAMDACTKRAEELGKTD